MKQRDVKRWAEVTFHKWYAAIEWTLYPLARVVVETWCLYRGHKYVFNGTLPGFWFTCSRCGQVKRQDPYSDPGDEPV